jgi:hypothetical protein
MPDSVAFPFLNEPASPATEAAVESLSAEQARAEIAKHRAGPVSSLPSNERMTKLYERAYAAPSPVAPAPETVAATKDKIAAIDGELFAIKDDTPRAQQLNAQRLELFKALYPEPQAVADPRVPRDDATPVLTDDDHAAAWRATAETVRHDGQPWNRDTVAQVHALMGAHLAPEDAAEYFGHALPILNAAAAEIARGLDVSPENTEALMQEEWGDEWEAKTLAAEAAWSKLPKAEQNEWTRSGLRYHPNVWRFLAALGSRIKQR